MKEFDYEAARAGAKVQTRDGRPVRIVCFDRKNMDYPVLALIAEEDGNESCNTYPIDGIERRDKSESSIDLVMVQDMGKDRKNTLQRLHARAKKMAYSEELRQYEGVSLKADNSFEFGYMVGAYQQMDLDIEKACEWLLCNERDLYWAIEYPKCSPALKDLSESLREYIEEE